MATLYKLPCIFVVENNKWAIGMSHARATGPSAIADDEPYIYKKGPAFGMPGVLVDGMDVRKVRGRMDDMVLVGLSPRRHAQHTRSTTVIHCMPNTQQDAGSQRPDFTQASDLLVCSLMLPVLCALGCLPGISCLMLMLDNSPNVVVWQPDFTRCQGTLALTLTCLTRIKP